MDDATRISPRSRLRPDTSDPFELDTPGDAWLNRLRRAEKPGDAGRIGPYEVLHEVGRGGQGVVYRARQPHLNRDIAIKRLVSGAFASESARRRFEREVEAVSTLSHPNIVTVYGMEIVDGQPLLAMEWIEGVAINRWSRPPQSPPRGIHEVLALFARVCDAVRYAHQRGVIHRDLKPGNILVVEEGTEARRHEGTKGKTNGGDSSLRASVPSCLRASPKLLDFGLAKLIRDQEQDAVEVTLSDEFVGTPAYASPEQMRLDNDAIDVRTDVYSLGVILHEMLTGQLPYPIPRNLAALIEIIQNVEPARPSAHDKRVERELDTIVLKTLAKEREHRYQSVDALADDVHRYLDGRPILAHPPSALYTVRKFVRRNPLASGLIGAVVLLVISFGLVAGGLAYQRTVARDRALDEAARLRMANSFHSDFFNEMQRARLHGGDPDPVACLQRAAEHFEQRRVEQKLAPFDLSPLLAQCYWRLGVPDKAEAAYRAALARCESENRGDSADAAEIMNEFAQLLTARGETDEAATLLRRALSIREARLGPDAGATLQTRINLAAMHLTIGRIEEAESLLADAVARLERAGEAYPRNLGIARLNLARARLARGNIDSGRALLVGAVQALRSAPSVAAPDLGEALHALGQFEIAQSRYVEAVPHLREALAIRRERAPDDLAAAHTAHLLALAVWAAGERGEAERLLRDALETWSRADEAWREPALDAVAELAMLVFERNRPDEARSLMRQTIAAHREHYGGEHAKTRALERAFDQMQSTSAPGAAPPPDD